MNSRIPNCKAALIVALIFAISGFSVIPAESQELDRLTPIGVDELANFRGGFVGPGGLQFTFGYDVTQSVLIPTLVGSSPGVGEIPAEAYSVTQLTNSTEVNQITNGITSVIQNTMSGAAIKSDAVINIDVTNFYKFAATGSQIVGQINPAIFSANLR